MKLDLEDEVNKKEKGILFLWVAVVVGVLLFTLYDQLFPKAPEYLLFDGTLTSHQVSYGQEEIDLSYEEFQAVLDHLYEAKPTRKLSVNDNPPVDSFYQMEFHTDSFQGTARLYLYQENDKIYFEIPYGHIYETDQSTLDLLQA